MSTDSHPQHPALKRVRTLSYWLDNSIAIPGTTYRIGLDPLIGLLPGAGDAVGVALSAYIVLEAARLGLPREALIRMVTNIVLDTVMGSLPIVGDFFDASWKSNTRNAALLEAHLKSAKPKQKVDKWLLAALFGGLFLVVVGLVAFSVIGIRLLSQAVSG
jgi:hypothetical protein